MTSSAQLHRRSIAQRQPAGFTLMEMLLVLAIIVVVGGVAWPLASRAYSGTRLRNAAEQIQAAWGKARVQAISTGLPHVFRFEIDAREYSVVAWYDETADVESNTPLGQFGPLGGAMVGAGQGTFGTAAPTTNFAGAATTTDRQLPEGMSFTGIERGSDSRVIAADMQLNQASIVATTPPIVFYPDGTSSDATLTITNGEGKFITVNLRGLTGVSRIGAISLGPATGPPSGAPDDAGVSP